MKPKKYQKHAMRTECDQVASLNRMGVTGEKHQPTSVSAIRLTHAALGLASEAGELCSAVEKWIYYGQLLDVDNVKEEIGDCLWRLAQACDVLGLDMGEVMKANVRKLQQRYPDKWSKERCEKRDKKAERAAVTKVRCGICSDPNCDNPGGKH